MVVDAGISVEDSKVNSELGFFFDSRWVSCNRVRMNDKFRVVVNKVGLNMFGSESKRQEGSQYGQVQGLQDFLGYYCGVFPYAREKGKGESK